MKLAARRNAVCWFVLSISAMCSAASAAEAPTLPETPAGRRMSAYLAAFNGGDAAALEAFLAAAFSPAALAERPVAPRLAFHSQVRGEQGRFEVLSLLDSQPNELTLEVRGTKSGDRVHLGLVVEPDEPHYVRSFRIEPIDEEEERLAPPGPSLSLDEAKAAIEALISEADREGRFSGVVAIRRGETPWVMRAVGLANREAGIANGMETRFNLGSIQKLFTQIVIARLCQEGKLRLTDRLVDALPSYPNAAVARKVTIGQLVEHKAGFGDFFGPEFRAEPHKVRTLADYLKLFADRPLLFEPGARSEYSNAGFIVLGLVIEAKTGLTYDEAARRFVFEPAGMKSTSLDRIENEAADRAVGYWKPEGPEGAWKANRNVLPGKGSSAGGSYSTAADLIRFVDAFRSDRLLDFGWTEWALGAPAPAAGSKAAPGARHHQAWGIAGGSEGVNAVLFLSAEDGSATVVLSNFDQPAAEKLFESVRNVLKRVRG